MPQWQTELEALLAQLHVSLDGDAATSAPSGDTRDLTLEHIQKDGSDPSIPWELGVLAAEEPLSDDAEDDEVSAVRSEIEATVRRVIDMARTGRLDGALRDDVVFVLQALTRPHPFDRQPRSRRSRQDAARHDWQLASAAAVLRFCRIVLRLTDAIGGDDDDDDEE